jgi:hypothetical protein
MGAVEAALAPTGPARLDVEARDGDVLLQLSEGPGVGYDLEAAATGDVSASMREAALEGEGSRAALRTPDAATRDARVQGEVVSVGGSIRFEGR